MQKKFAPLALVTAGLLVVGGGVASAQNDSSQRRDGDITDQVIAEAKAGPAKNVIMIVGDGMGDSELTAARNYEYGAGGELPGLDKLPLTGAMTTYSVTKDGKTDYVPDSASTSTGWATGSKTYDGAIAVDVDGNPLDSTLKIAKRNGKKTGNITTAEVQDATPASQVANVKDRACYDPSSTECGDDALAKGGPGSISEQLLQTRPDVTMGGGASYFKNKVAAGEYKGKTLRNSAKSQGYNLIDDKAALDKVTKADQDAPVLALFEPKTMATTYVGKEAGRGGASGAAQTCKSNPDIPKTSPDLAAMTRKSIELLDNEKGFYLQVEGASIDKQAHGRNACGQIGETVALDRAVQEALKFAEQDGNTLVVVTADHAHNGQIVDTGSAPREIPSARLSTKEGSEMTMVYPNGGHTGTQVRIGAYGPAAANVSGLIDQTDVFGITNRALELDPAAR